MYNRRSFLVVSGTCLATGLAGCTEGESPTEQSEPDPTDESDSGDETQNTPASVAVAREFFTALSNGNEERVYELSHPRVKEVLADRYSEPDDLTLDTVQRVSEAEATTGEQSAPEPDMTGVEEILADGMAESVQWLLVTFDTVEGEFYVPMLKHEGEWLYYEAA